MSIALVVGSNQLQDHVSGATPQYQGFNTKPYPKPYPNPNQTLPSSMSTTAILAGSYITCVYNRQVYDTFMLDVHILLVFKLCLKTLESLSHLTNLKWVECYNNLVPLHMQSNFDRRDSL
jgi:hypothetical protein